jgi:pectin methylesterase-like acyl-CoA thioesterase
MGRLSDESFEQFLDSLKEAGIAIFNEDELRVRLAEAQRWQYAFATLAANGKPLGIQFVNCREGTNDAQIWNTFARFDFPTQLQAVFADSLKPEH